MNEPSFLMKETLKLLKPTGLDTLIHFVTSSCNVLCDHCFYKEDLNQPGDLSLGEIERITEKLLSLRCLLVGGGEPFLRKDLAEIIDAYVRNCKIDFLQIPTNGFYTDRTFALTEKTLANYPHLNQTIAVSLDGMAEVHDTIRHKEGLFDQAIKTLKALSTLKGKEKKLRIIVVSVLMPDNLSSCQELAYYIRETVDPDLHWFEPVREVEMSKGFTFSKQAFSFMNENLKYYWNKNKGTSASIYGSDLLNNMVTEFSVNNFRIAFNNVLDKKLWPFSCSAGHKITVLYPDGDLAACELREVLGNIRDFDFNLPAGLKSKVFKDERKQIAQERCDCSHGCFITASARHSPLNLFKTFWQSLRSN